jgi:hypothetical protein
MKVVIHCVSGISRFASGDTSPHSEPFCAYRLIGWRDFTLFTFLTVEMIRGFALVCLQVYLAFKALTAMKAVV